MLKESIKNLMEIVSLSEDEIKENDKNVTAILDLEDLKSLKEVLEHIEEHKEDLSTVYLKGVYDGKEKATIDQSICKERMAKDALNENVRLKKKIDKIEEYLNRRITPGTKFDNEVEKIIFDEVVRQLNIYRLEMLKILKG